MINSLAYRLIQLWPNFYVAQIWQLWLADHRLQRTWPKSGFHDSKRERYHCTMRLTSMAQSGASRNISRDRFGLSNVFWCPILEAEKMRGKKWVNCFRMQKLEVFFETVFTNRYLERKLISNKWLWLQNFTFEPNFHMRKVQKISRRTWLTKLVMENYINFAFHFNKGLKVRQICHILTKIINNRYYRFVMSKCS